MTIRVSKWVVPGNRSSPITFSIMKGGPLTCLVGMQHSPARLGTTASMLQATQMIRSRPLQVRRHWMDCLSRPARGGSKIATISLASPANRSTTSLSLSSTLPQMTSYSTQLNLEFQAASRQAASTDSTPMILAVVSFLPRQMPMVPIPQHKSSTTSADPSWSMILEQRTSHMGVWPCRKAMGDTSNLQPRMIYQQVSDPWIGSGGLYGIESDLLLWGMKDTPLRQSPWKAATSRSTTRFLALQRQSGATCRVHPTTITDSCLVRWLTLTTKYLQTPVSCSYLLQGPSLASSWYSSLNRVLRTEAAWMTCSGIISTLAGSSIMTVLLVKLPLLKPTSICPSLSKPIVNYVLLRYLVVCSALTNYTSGSSSTQSLLMACAMLLALRVICSSQGVCQQGDTTVRMSIALTASIYYYVASLKLTFFYLNRSAIATNCLISQSFTQAYLAFSFLCSSVKGSPIKVDFCYPFSNFRQPKVFFFCFRRWVGSIPGDSFDTSLQRPFASIKGSRFFRQTKKLMNQLKIHQGMVKSSSKSPSKNRIQKMQSSKAVKKGSKSPNASRSKPAKQQPKGNHTPHASKSPQAQSFSTLHYLRWTEVTSYFECSQLPGKHPRRQEWSAPAEIPASDLDRFEEKLEKISIIRKQSAMEPIYEIAQKEQAAQIRANSERIEKQSAHLLKFENVPKEFMFQYLSRHQITHSDLTKLEEGQDLNDSLINFYLAFLGENAKAGLSILPFNSFFYDKLSNGFLKNIGVVSPEEVQFLAIRETKYAQVKRWIKKSLFEQDLILIPLNFPGHWNLAAIVHPGQLLLPLTERTKKPYLLFLDSYCSSYSFVFETLKVLLVMHAKERLGLDLVIEGLVEKALMLPRQTNLHDCGLYLLQNAEILARTDLIDKLQAGKDLVHAYSRAIIMLKRGLMLRLIVDLQNGRQNAAERYFETCEQIERKESKNRRNFVDFDEMLYKKMFEIGLWEPSHRGSETYRYNFYYRPQFNFYQDQ